MYHIIGLKKDGSMVLYALEERRPSLEDLEEVAEAEDYTQLLITHDQGGQVVRFEILSSLVREVPLV